MKRLLLLILALWLAPSAPAQTDPETSVKGGTIANTNLIVSPYLRVTDGAKGGIALQVSSRSFIPVEGKGPRVLLVAVTHIGESNYFRLLQKSMEEYDLVLFEGIMPERKGGWSGKAFETIRSSAAGEAEGEQGNIQTELAKALKLAFQLNAISYDQPNYRNSDLSIEAMQRILMGPPPKPGARPAKTPEPEEAPDRSLDQLMQMMQGEGFFGKLLVMGVQIIGANPRLQAVTKLTLIETLGRLKGDLAKTQSLPPQLARLFKVIIHSRNQKVVFDLENSLKQPDPPGSIAVFYGAGHMDDLERRVREQLNYKPDGDVWHPAFNVDTKDSGISQFEVNMIRFMVQQQMRMLFPEKN
jgi:hypothetical protein